MMFRYPFVAMGSGCEVLVEADSAAQVKPMIQSALTQIARLEAKYSRFRHDSLVARINREAHMRTVPLDEETQTLLGLADRLYRDTGGRFDITVGSLQACWDFRAMRLPDAEALARGLSAVGWAGVQWSTAGIRLPRPNMQLDLGGLVKEYALDVAVSVLATLGVGRGLVNLGGDVRVVGSPPPSGRAFQVGVAHPRRHHGLCATLSLSAGALVTSGDYQRYFIRDGVRYHHLLDPATGYPLPLRHAGLTTHGATAMAALHRGKAMLLTDSAEPPGDGAYLACDGEGEPSAWRDAPGCEVRIHHAAPARQVG
jgi:thiamine biosynthesis lipoprotein